MTANAQTVQIFMFALRFCIHSAESTLSAAEWAQNRSDATPGVSISLDSCFHRNDSEGSGCARKDSPLYK